MVFNSLDYLFFFAIVTLLYYLIPQRKRYILLLVAGCIFYMCWNVGNIIVLLYIIVITYTAGQLLDRSFTTKSKKMICALTGLFSFGVLFLYKYLDFFIKNLSIILNKFGMEINYSPLELILPIGISFFIFQAFGYVIDVYKGKCSSEKNFIKYAAFVAFFPNLLSGPIERADNLLRQISEGVEGNLEKVKTGLLQIAWGLYLKVVLSNNIAPIVDVIYENHSAYRGIEIIIATILFGIQIYCDFAGYSYMAVGSARVLGYTLMDNFREPYFSGNVADFWRRWHISLTSWFRDYVYIPLGGNRKGKIRKYMNTMLVFLLSGLWHGANWSYVFWGGLNGCYIVIEDFFKSIFHKNKKVPFAISCIGTFLLVDYAWMFFRADSFRQGMDMTRMIFFNLNPEYLFNGTVIREFGGGKKILLLVMGILLLTLVDYLQYKKNDIIKNIFSRFGLIRWGIYLGLLLIILVFGIYGYSYEQTQFIYFQF